MLFTSLYNSFLQACVLCLLTKPTESVVEIFDLDGLLLHMCGRKAFLLYKLALLISSEVMCLYPCVLVGPVHYYSMYNYCKITNIYFCCNISSIQYIY